MFEYIPLIQQIYSGLDELLKSKEGLEKALTAAEITTNVYALKNGLDETAEKIRQLEEKIAELQNKPQLAEET